MCSGSMSKSNLLHIGKVGKEGKMNVMGDKSQKGLCV